MTLVEAPGNVFLLISPGVTAHHRSRRRCAADLGKAGMGEHRQGAVVEHGPGRSSGTGRDVDRVAFQHAGPVLRGILHPCREQCSRDALSALSDPDHEACGPPDPLRGVAIPHDFRQRGLAGDAGVGRARTQLQPADGLTIAVGQQAGWDFGLAHLRLQIGAVVLGGVAVSVAGGEEELAPAPRRVAAGAEHGHQVRPALDRCRCDAQAFHGTQSGTGHDAVPSMELP